MGLTGAIFWILKILISMRKLLQIYVKEGFFPVTY